MDTNNKLLRMRIVEMIYNAEEGHIPSAFCIIDLLSAIYKKILKFNPNNPAWEGRDYFVLSKGHGCAALYVVLEKYGFITSNDIEEAGKKGGILGGHPDCIKIPGVEASTGSLGHGLVTAMGIALGLKIRKKNNKVITLIGDGEVNEGTVWETALVAQNLKLGNFCVILDDNRSSQQILKLPDLKKMWESFGWDVHEIDGHNEEEIISTFNNLSFDLDSKPKLVLAHTVKGKGVSFMEGQGSWHHKIPNEEELKLIKQELLNG